MKDKNKFSRRKFFQKGAIVLGGTVVASYFGCSPLRRFAAQKTENMDLPAVISSYQPDFWFQILDDNTIQLNSPKVEMGQGVFTGLAMLAAEELEIPLSQIKVKAASTSTEIIDKLGTGGSSSTLSLYEPIREVAATMREMLKLAAAKKWNIDITKIEAKNGYLISSKNKASYAEIAKNTKEWEIPKTPKLKPKSEFKYVGTEQKRIDLEPKVFGTAQYTIDTELPDILHAVTLHSPYFEGKIKTIDFTEAEKSEGVVKVIRKDEIVAVVAATRYAASEALKKIKVSWDVPKNWQQKDMLELVTVGKTKAINIQKEGRAKAILAKNEGEIYSQEYRTSIAAHATMETFGSVANVNADAVTVIIGTQNQGLIQEQVAKDLDIKKKNVDVQVPYIGGGFGRKTPKNNASTAAYLSKLVWKPVKLIPSREQEFQDSLYRPNTHHVLKAKIGKDGEIEAISHDQATPDMILKTMAGSFSLKLLGADWISAGHGASILYNIENKSTNIWNVEVPYSCGIWRGVGMFANTFATESFIDELAIKTKKHPLDFRRNLLSKSDEIQARMGKVLEELKAKTQTPKNENQGRGYAICSDRKAIAAVAIDVSLVNESIKVDKVTMVFDVGLAVNPDGIRSQAEGCIMMGISAGLFEEILVKDGKMDVENFHQYPLAKLSDTPKIEIVILENSNEPFGVGEPSLSPIAPAIANAIFNLTGKRLRTLPLQKALDNFIEA